MRIDGSFEAEQKIDEHIADVLHRDIADFFFFDGEMLNRYEDLLSDDASAAPLIKRSIEQILGLPALQSMATDLEDLERGATRKHAQALKAAKSHAALATQAQDLGKSLVAVEEDLEALNRLLLKEEAEKEGLRQKRQRFAQVEAEAKALGAVEDEIRELEAERRLQKEACRAILSDSWWLPVAPMANAHFEIATAELTEATGHLAKAERLRDEIRRTQEALQRGECPSCGGSVSGEARRRLERQESEAAADLAALPAVSPGDLGEKGQALTQLKVFGDLRPMQAFVDAERHYRRQGLEIRRRERRADSIREALRGHDEAEIRDLEHHYDAVVGRIADVAKSIEAQTLNRNRLETDYRRVQAQMRRAVGVDPQIAGQAAGMEVLRDAFAGAVASFREQLRLEVEGVASEIFARLTSASDLKTLRINQNYGLRIINEGSREITTRSAGAEQIVALSLIGALNRCAVREGPVVMDTPFGRLDKTHRKNILQYVPHMSRQVVLLVQSGEFERGRDLPFLGPVVGREFELRRAGSSTRTEVVEL